MKKFLIAGMLAFLPAQADAFHVQAVRVAKVKVQRVVVQKVVQVQQVQQVVAVQRVVAAQVVYPVQAVSVVQPLVSYGYGVQQFVAPAYAAPIYGGGESQALQIERERTKQEQLRTEAIRLQLTAPK